jgi:hypothetical protein
VDALESIRTLKEYNVNVIFEKEHIESMKVEGELLRVYVRDSGIGVASEKTKNVFFVENLIYNPELTADNKQ